MVLGDTSSVVFEETSSVVFDDTSSVGVSVGADLSSKTAVSAVASVDDSVASAASVDCVASVAGMLLMHSLSLLLQSLKLLL